MPQAQHSPLDSTKITVSQGLLGLNILMYGAQVASKDAITAWGAKVNQLILAGQWWRLVTPAFFHGNIMHLVVNCYSLYNIAPALEGLCGGKRLIVTYLAAAVTGNVASFYGSAAPSLGASGAVFGLGGALAMYFYRNKELYGKRSDFILKQLWQTLLLNIAYGFANPRIDNWYVFYIFDCLLFKSSFRTLIYFHRAILCTQGWAIKRI